MHQHVAVVVMKAAVTSCQFASQQLVFVQTARFAQFSYWLMLLWSTSLSKHFALQFHAKPRQRQNQSTVAHSRELVLKQED